MMKNKILIIDGNNALYRAYYKYSGLSGGPKDLPTGIIYGFPYMLNAMLKLHKPDDVFIVFDGARDKKRLELHPEYKGKRKQKDEFDKDDFYRQRDQLLLFLSCLGIKYILPKKKEADDVIWLLTKRLKLKNQVVIVSSDHDFPQLISENVSVFSPKNDKRYTHLNFEKELGFPHTRVVEYLILDGDKSDNIPGVVGVGPASIKDFFSKWDSIESYLKSDKPEMSKFPRRILEEVFIKNRQLIDIRRFVKNYMKLSDYEIKIPKNKKGIDKKELQFLCSNHGINTFTTSNFLGAFYKLLETNKNHTLCSTLLQASRE